MCKHIFTDMYILTSAILEGMQTTVNVLIILSSEMCVGMTSKEMTIKIKVCSSLHADLLLFRNNLF